MQLLLHLPDDIAKRFQMTIPARKRSAFVRDLLEKYLPKENDELLKSAMALEADNKINDDLAIWDETSNDGLDDLP